MTTTKHKPFVDPNFSTDTIKYPKWRNLYFMKSGTIVYGTEIHDTADIAKATTKEFEEAVEKHRHLGIKPIISVNGNDVTDYSHNIQIPAK